MKKLLSFVCALALVTGAAAALPEVADMAGAGITASSWGGGQVHEHKTDGDWEYFIGGVGSLRFDDNGVPYPYNYDAAYVCGYLGSDTEITIPPEIEGYPTILPGQEDLKGFDNIKTLILPPSSDMVSFSSYTITHSFPSLTEILFSGESEEYVSIDGAVYDKKESQLFIVPCGKKTLNIWEDVKSLSVSWDNLSVRDIYYSGTMLQWEGVDKVFEPENVVIHCSDGDIDERVPSETGDVNRDGKVNMKDYSALQQYLSGWGNIIADTAADINADGKITMKDYAALQRLLNGWK